MTHVVALGITTDGTNVPLSLREGSTENATVATALLSDLTDRGLRLHEGQLLCSTAPRRSARRSATWPAPGRRCSAACGTNERNVLGHLPERDRPLVRRRLRAAWALDDHDRALDQLRALADELARTHPGATASLREGMEETLTVTRLGVSGALKRTLCSTTPIESMIDTVRTIQRNVKRWRDGDMRLRWTAAGMAEAQRGSRRVKGHRDRPKLVPAIARELNPTEELTTVLAA